MTTAREMLLDTMTQEEYSYETSDKHTIAKMAATMAAGWLTGKLVAKAYDKTYWTVAARNAAKAVTTVVEEID